MTRQGKRRQHNTSLGWKMQWKTRQDGARRDGRTQEMINQGKTTRQGNKTREGKTAQDNTSLGKTRQRKTRQDKKIRKKTSLTASN